MRYEILGGDAFPVIKVFLKKGETMKAESGAMVAMSQGMALTSKMDGGLGKALGRMLSGESFFMQALEAEKSDGWAMLTTPVPGGITPYELKKGVELLVQKDGFVAGSQGVEVSTKMQNLVRGLFSGEGFFVVKLTGEGTVFLSTYGSIYPLEIPAGEEVIVDNGHLIAWESHLKYEITKGAKGWTSAFLSGAGIACRFQGPGTVLIQSRNPWSLGRWLFPLLPIPSPQQG